MTRTVTINTETSGVNFAVTAVIRDAQTRQLLYCTAPRPYGFSVAARCAAVAVAEDNGWSVVSR